MRFCVRLEKYLTGEGKSRSAVSDGLPTSRFYVVGRHRILVTVVEMSPQIIHDRGNLVVAHHRSEWRHSALPVDDDVNRISAGFEISVARKRGICSGTCCTFAVRHVAAPTNTGKQSLPALLGEFETGAERRFECRGPGALGMCHARCQQTRRRHRYDQACASKAGISLHHLEPPNTTWMTSLYVLTTRSCSRAIASRDDRIAPSCHAGMQDACSPANKSLPSIWQRLS
jgi:hypothetical protein